MEQQSAQFYQPGPIDHAGAQLELRKVANGLEEMRQVMIFSPQAKLPPMPTDGMFGYFQAGVAGVGAGFYGYEAGAWVKL